MSAQQEILDAFAEGYHPMRPLGAMLSDFKAEVLREAAEKIRAWGRAPGQGANTTLIFGEAADLIDPDKDTE